MNNYEDRKLIFQILFITISLVFIVRLLFLQVVQSRVQDAGLFEEVLYPSRGLVYDRYGELLVYNDALYDLMIVPRQAKGIDTLRLCKILGIDKAEFIYRVKRIRRSKNFDKYKPYAIEKDLSEQMYGELQENIFRFNGLFIQTRTDRKYPKRSGAHLLGYIREVTDNEIEKSKGYYLSGDNIGKSGLERSYEDDLRGKRGVKFWLVDVFHRKQGSYKNGSNDTPAIAGKDLTTSLAAKLQEYGELLMQNKVGSVVAIEPKTGEVLALISSPTYDPNLLLGRHKSTNYVTLERDPLKPLFIRPLGAKYPPGSIFKIIQALIGQQEGVLNTTTSYSCNRGINIGSLHVGCHPHGSPLNLIQSVQHSCNAYYVQVFRSIIDQDKFPKTEEGYLNWRNKVASFGIGQKLGIDLPYELGGNLPSNTFYNKVYGKDRWKSSTIISLSIGQGELGITPLQMANVVSIIANKGYYYAPHLVKAIGKEMELKDEYKIKHEVPIAREYFDVITEGMYNVVQGGTGYVARINGIDVCGKTGTAQNPHGKDHSVFFAFAPKDNPKIAIAVVVENAGFGAEWAAPISSLMIEKYLRPDSTCSRPALEKRILEGNLLKYQKEYVKSQNTITDK